jgi:hypothetical protein
VQIGLMARLYLMTVFYNATKVQTVEGPKVEVKKILRYAHDINLYVEIESIENKIYYVPIDHPDFMKSTLPAYSRSAFAQYLGDEKLEKLNRIPVDPENCFLGLFGMLRIICILIFLILGMVLKLSNKTQTGDQAF